tara:strand:+ start:34980 stop:36578 length:1599 start_codon:yes stop_codon:yes gene_type:complete
MGIKILDCTLRDGGYYNDWSFNKDLVDRYLQAMSLCNVDIVELGLRNDPKDNKDLNFSTTTEDFLKQFDLPKNLEYSVMLNAKDFEGQSQEEIKDNLADRFLFSENSVVSIVRLAVNYEDVLFTKTILEELKLLGYKIGLNLMQANGKTEESYFEVSSEINSWGLVDVLYFADSLGNMNPDDIKRINTSLSKGWVGETGFHSHNNKGFALANAVCAIQEGIAWCDCTMTGMGRGAGNVTTESLLMELNNLKIINSDLSYLQASLIDFEKIKDTHKWGPNMFYQFAANNNIHPTFVQSLLADSRYDEHQIFQFLQNLSKKSSSSYSALELRESIYGSHEEKKGSWDATGWLSNQDVVLIAGGPSTKDYKEQAIALIKESNHKVLFININEHISNNLGDATIVSHEMRALLDSSKYKELEHPLILPMKSLGMKIIEDISDITILDYGLNLKEGAFIINPKSATLNWPLSAAYALAIVTQAGARSIKLIGFDGYEKDDIRYHEMEEVLTTYRSLENAIEITSLTPTLFNVKTSLL